MMSNAVQDSSETAQVRIRRDVNGDRTDYEEFEVGKDLGSAVFFVTQKEIDAVCEQRDFYHPWYSVGSPFQGRTIVPVALTYHIARRLFTSNYSVCGLLHRWAFESLAPLHPYTRYEFSAHVSDKWIRNDREYVAYEGTCKDETGTPIFTTRRVHVLDYIKRTAPKTGEDGLDSYGRSPDSPNSLALAAMAAAASAGPSAPQDDAPEAASHVMDVQPIANLDTQLGAPMPSLAMSFSQARFDRDFPSHEGHGGAETRSRHIDPEALQQEGLPSPFAGAVAVMGLVHNSAMQLFGRGWVVGGRAELTMRRPVFLGDFVTSNGYVKSKELLSDGSVRLTCEAWVEGRDGERKVVGTVSGIVPAS